MATGTMSEVRELLADKGRTLELALGMLAQYADSQGHVFGSGLPLFTQAAALLIRRNIELAYAHAESHIERLFLGALIVGFAQSAPSRLRLVAPMNSAPENLAAFRESHEAAKSWLNTFVEQGGNGDDISGFARWLDEVEAKTEKMPFKDDLWSAAVFPRLQMGDCLISPQASFPALRVGGRSIRVDLLCWRLEDSTTRIVECDGYEFHKTPERFIGDRQRDRVLRNAGFEVSRFSGAEIFADPVKASAELFELLTR